VENDVYCVYQKGGAEMIDRTEVLSGRFTARERRIVEAECKRQGMDLAGYVRAAVMTSLVLDGNKEAMRITAEMVHERLKRWVQDRAMDRLAEVVTA
jgi:serine kinase of HPr protein (carbohydrate metabolism regulator)